MPSTLLLNPGTWDLMLDADGNLAVASEPYSLAQDAASAIQTWLGEVFYDTTLGVPWVQQILGKNPPIMLLKQVLIDQAMTVPNVASATVFLTSASQRGMTGQVQVTSKTTGQTAVSSFAVINPQVE